MTWALVALLGYFFAAVSSVFDKYLLSDRIPAPAVYAFFVSLFSLFTVVFIPFGFSFSTWRTTGILLLSGVLFVYGLVALYTAVKQHEVSRVAPLVGAVISLVAFSTVFLPGLLEGNVELWPLLALGLLIAGGLLISFDLPLRRGEHISRFVVVAGVLMGVSLLLLKAGFGESNFVSGLVWSRFGMVLGGLSLLCIPLYRNDIVAQFRVSAKNPKKKKRALGTSVLFLLNKSSAGIASFLVTYALSLGSVAFVQALSGMQYVFILVMTLGLSFRFHHIFGERLFFWDWVQKLVAILIIGAGLWLATMSGVPLLLPV
ncbi:MAG: hypothetical protein Q8O53_03880 [Candidatus Moranbacteria bacterium]|nr:hypothetical protein [Candidatus Moranbacteria bacterium]